MQFYLSTFLSHYQTFTSVSLFSPGPKQLIVQTNFFERLSCLFLAFCTKTSQIMCKFIPEQLLSPTALSDTVSKVKDEDEASAPPPPQCICDHWPAMTRRLLEDFSVTAAGESKNIFIHILQTERSAASHSQTSCSLRPKARVQSCSCSSWSHWRRSLNLKIYSIDAFPLPLEINKTWSCQKFTGY